MFNSMLQYLSIGYLPPTCPEQYNMMSHDGIYAANSYCGEIIILICAFLNVLVSEHDCVV